MDTLEYYREKLKLLNCAKLEREIAGVNSGRIERFRKGKGISSELLVKLVAYFNRDK